MKKYDSYKDSGIEWIGEIPSHWMIKKGKYLFKIVSGYSPENVEEQIRKFGIPYFKVNDLNDKSEVFNLEKSNLYVADDILNTSPKETILFPKRGAAISTNKVKISTSDCIFDTNIMGLIPFKEKIHCRYLAYSISNRGLWDIADTSTIPQINNKHIEPLEFVLPETIEEQIQITNFLDHKTSQIDHLIAKKEQFIKLLEEERVAVINQAVTKGLDPNVPMKDSGVEWLEEIPEHWGYSSLKWYSKIYSGGTPSKDVDEYWLNGTIPWLNSGCVNQWDIKEVSDYITEDAFNNSSAKWIPNKSLVIALAGQGKTKGMVAQVQFETTCNQSLGVIVPNEKMHSRFLQYWLKNNYQNIRNLGGGDKRDGLNLVMIGGIPIPVFPLNEQEKIANYLDSMNIELDSIKSKTQQEIELLKEYKTALISEVVTGKFDVRNVILN